MSKITTKYNAAKQAKVGQECTCPSCGTKFIKTNYQQAFCKSKGGTVCKDKYWNTVTPTKRNNTTRISPASAAYMVQKNSDVYSGAKFTGYTSEGYRVIDGIAYNEFGEPVYNVGIGDYDNGDSEYWDNSDNFVNV